MPPTSAGIADARFVDSSLIFDTQQPFSHKIGVDSRPNLL